MPATTTAVVMYSVFGICVYLLHNGNEQTKYKKCNKSKKKSKCEIQIVDRTVVRQ